jgi:hypothetical protein
MDISTFYDLNDNDRVARLLKHVGTMKSGLTFGRRQRLDRQDYKWMPATFVSEAVPVSGPDAAITADGLQAIFPGGYLDFPPKGLMIGAGSFGCFELSSDYEDSDSDDDGDHKGAYLPKPDIWSCGQANREAVRG